MNIEIRKLHNGFIFTMSGDTTNKRATKKEKVACSVVEMVGLIVEHFHEVYGEDGK